MKSRGVGGHLVVRLLVPSLSATVLACGAQDIETSDYEIYSRALEALSSEASLSEIVIRRIAAVETYGDMVYDARDLPYVIEEWPTMDPALWDLARVRMEERPTLADSFDVAVAYSFLESDLFDSVASRRPREAYDFADSALSLGSQTRVVCLTPPAVLNDQALIFIAEGCWDRRSLIGRNYFLQRQGDAWEVVGISPWSVN